MKAMVLAAGFGKRLLPFTENTPKPAVKLLGYPLIYYSFSLLAEAGINEFVVNTHYLPEYVKKTVLDGFGRFNIQFSDEPVILGTGGGIRNASGMLFSNDNRAVIINSDIVADVNIRDVVNFHDAGGHTVTMVLRNDPDADNYGAVFVDNNLRVAGIREIYNNGSGTGNYSKHMFTGIHIIDKDVVNDIPEGTSSIIPAYNSIIKAGKSIGAYVMNGYWEDFGRVEKLNEALKNPCPFVTERREILEKFSTAYGIN